jgi:hypothetical protein
VRGNGEGGGTELTEGFTGWRSDGDGPSAVDGVSRCVAIRDMERWSLLEKWVVGGMGEVRLPFIGAKGQGGSQSEELNGGQ